MTDQSSPTFSPKVFICYVRGDEAKASEIYDFLTDAGADPWLDKKALVLGDDWEAEIKKAVSAADAMIVCLRPGFDAIGFRQKEVHWALEAMQMRPPGRGFVIPFMVKPCELPDWCKPLHAGGDLAKPTDLEDLVGAVEKHCHVRLQRPLPRVTLLLEMAAVSPPELANCAHGYGNAVEDVRGEMTDPGRWSIPGWRRLSTLSREELLNLARGAWASGQLTGGLAYLKVAALIGSSGDVENLLRTMQTHFLSYPRLAEDTIDCVASLVTRNNLALLRTMAKAGHPYLRRAAATGLGIVGTRDDLAILAELATDECPHPGRWDVGVRDSAAEALGNLGFPEGLPILKAMVPVPPGDVLPVVAAAIARLGLTEGLPAIEGIAKVGYLPAQYAGAKAYAELLCGGDLARLRQLAKNGNALMVEGALWVLKDRGSPEDASLARAILTRAEGNLQCAAVATIGKLGKAEDLPCLRKLATESRQWPLRRWAVRAIGAIGEHADFALLTGIAAQDEVMQVRRASACACWQLATRGDLPFIDQTIRNPGTVDRLRGSVKAKARLCDDSELVAAMKACLFDPRPFVARIASEAIVSRISPERCRSVLELDPRRLSPDAAAVFDWYFNAPHYLHQAYAQWRAKRKECPAHAW